MKKLILGTAQLGMSYGVNNIIGPPNELEAHKILGYAQLNGVEFLDTADSYGDSYNIINSYHKSSRHLFRLMTKFKFIDQSKTIADVFHETKNRLNFERLYNYSFHRFEDANASPHVSSLLRLKENREIESIGISVYGNDEFESAIDMDFIDIIQCPFNLLDNFQRRGDLILKAKSKGKKIHVRSIFLQGMFFKKHFENKFTEFSSVIERLESLAKRYEMEIGEMALRYALSFPEFDGILIGVETMGQLERNIDLFRKGNLERQQIYEIHKINLSDTHLLNPVNW